MNAYNKSSFLYSCSKTIKNIWQCAYINNSRNKIIPDHLNNKATKHHIFLNDHKLSDQKYKFIDTENEEKRTRAIIPITQSQNGNFLSKKKKLITINAILAYFAVIIKLQ